MTILAQIEKRTSAFRVRELAALLSVTPQYIYKLVSRGIIPSLHMAGPIRLDPHDVAAWIRQAPKMVRKHQRPVA